MTPILSRRTSIVLRTLLLAVVGGVVIVWATYRYQVHQGRRHAVERDSATAAAIRHALDPASLASEEAGMPRFEAHPVADTFTGTPAPVDLNRAEEARQFGDVLRRGAAKGPNFAGYYTVVSWDLENGFKQFAVVDARNGRVVMGHYISFGVSHRLDSSLLITDPIDQWRKEYGPESQDPAGTHAQSYYYRWDGERLEHINSLTLGSDARADGAVHMHMH